MSFICKASFGSVMFYIIDVILVLAIVSFLYIMFFKRRPKTPIKDSNDFDNNSENGSEPEYIIKSEKPFFSRFKKAKELSEDFAEPMTEPDLTQTKEPEQLFDDESVPEIVETKIDEPQPNIQSKPNEDDEKVKNFQHKIVVSKEVNKTEPISKKRNALVYDKSEALINSIKTAPEANNQNNKKDE